MFSRTTNDTRIPLCENPWRRRRRDLQLRERNLSNDHFFERRRSQKKLLRFNNYFQTRDILFFILLTWKLIFLLRNVFPDLSLSKMVSTWRNRRWQRAFYNKSVATCFFIYIFWIAVHCAHQRVDKCRKCMRK